MATNLPVKEYESKGACAKNESVRQRYLIVYVIHETQTTQNLRNQKKNTVQSIVLEMLAQK